MQLKALTKSAIGMTDEQCQPDKMPGLRGGRELTMAQVAKLPRLGGSWPVDLVIKAGTGTDFYRGGEQGEIAAPRQVGARNDKVTWCWMKETAIEHWRRDLNLQVSSLFLGLMNRTTISARGALSTGRAPVGRGR